MLPAKVFGTSPEFWLNGQLALDLYLVIDDNEAASPSRVSERVSTRTLSASHQFGDHLDRGKLCTAPGP
jgi:plasmid maintenance system antidote protein VapI